MTLAGRQTLLRAGTMVEALTVVGRALGYARHVAVAAAPGAGPVADAFFVAFRAAVFMRAPFAGRGMGAVFFPMFTRRSYARTRACRPPPRSSPPSPPAHCCHRHCRTVLPADRSAPATSAR